MRIVPALLIAVPLAVTAAASPVSKAVATVNPTKDSKVSGEVSFTKVEGGVHVVAHLSGLAAGAHGFHIHEFGDCSAPDGASAGGHFNPSAHKHGAPTDEDHHAGDLGNVTAGADGTASLDVVDKAMSLEGADGILGRGVIVHANADDFKTQPTGNAGGRVACGVIGAAKGQ
jgi:Cu-Zn family superoxide dismutase